MKPTEPGNSPAPEPGTRTRRPRYAGKYPRKFEQKYKEHQPDRYGDTIEKVLASGKTPAGMHRPIMVQEVLEALALQPGDKVVDCTLGYGGHATEILSRISPGGRLIGLDADPLELPKTEARLRGLGFGPEVLLIRRTNFAGISRVLAELGVGQVNAIFADLGVSSMQLDQPSRGFSLKADGPLDMRMNPLKGLSAAELIARTTPGQLAQILRDNADEPRAEIIAQDVAGKKLISTMELRRRIMNLLPKHLGEEAELSVRRVFQALRIAVNDEFGALDALLKQLPLILAPQGRVAFLTFHSGEDRRVKKGFAAGLGSGVFQAVSQEVIRPGFAEKRDNPRSSPAKLRWAKRVSGYG